MTLLPWMMEEFDNAPLGPVVSNGAGLPVEDNGCVSDGQQVRTRVVDLHSIPVFQQGDREVVCKKERERKRGEEKEDGEERNEKEKER